MGETLKRAIFGAVFVAVVVLACWVSYMGLLLLLAVVSSIGLVEWYKMQGLNNKVLLGFGFLVNFMLLGLGNPVLINVQMASYTMAAAQLGGVVLLMLVYALVRYKQECINVVQSVISAWVILSLPCILLLKISLSGDIYNFKWPLAIFILIWLSDTMAYVAGRAIGKHKLFEVLSPKKTMEGWLGGAVFSALGGVFLFYFWELGSWWQGAIMAFLIAVFGVFGDLFFSSIKRNVGVKDTGNIIPGHGGILDRFDAFFFAVPVAYLWLAINLIV